MELAVGRSSFIVAADANDSIAAKARTTQMTELRLDTGSNGELRGCLGSVPFTRNLSASSLWIIRGLHPQVKRLKYRAYQDLYVIFCTEFGEEILIFTYFYPGVRRPEEDLRFATCFQTDWSSNVQRPDRTVRALLHLRWNDRRTGRKPLGNLLYVASDDACASSG